MDFPSRQGSRPQSAVDSRISGALEGKRPHEKQPAWCCIVLFCSYSGFWPHIHTFEPAWAGLPYVRFTAGGGKPAPPSLECQSVRLSFTGYTTVGGQGAINKETSWNKWTSFQSSCVQSFSVFCRFWLSLCPLLFDFGLNEQTVNLPLVSLQTSTRLCTTARWDSYFLWVFFNI